VDVTASLKRFLADQSGTGAEKAILVSVIAVIVLPAASGLGGKLVSVFGTLTQALR
jgi:Flp pilus assembly pilin Flp